MTINDPPQGPIPNSALPVDETGWAKEEVWIGGEGDGTYGDYVRGLTYTTRYTKGDMRFEIGYYVEALNGDDEGDGDLIVTECDHAFRVPRPGDDNDEGEPFDETYEYELGSVFGPETVEAGQRTARDLAMRDERPYLIWNPERTN